MKMSATMPVKDGKMPHLRVSKEEISSIVLMPGNPSRVDMVGKLLNEFKIISYNREYKIGVGKYKNQEVTVCSTGIGGPSTEIAVLELIALGAKALIRIGGTGTINELINVGDMIITTGSMRMGGSSINYVRPEYPAVASYEVIESLIAACELHDTGYSKGLGVSVGSYYAGQARSIAGKEFHEQELIEYYRNLNILNIEMEAETILTLSNLYGVFSGAICAVHGNRVTDEWLEDFEPAQEIMCKIALDAALILSNKYL